MISHPRRPITLVVATTPIHRRPQSKLDSHDPSSNNGAPQRSPCNDNHPLTLGIGQSNSLPWPRIKSDMTFFARVTSRPPQLSVSNSEHEGKTVVNAVIMGRKTYDSLPPKFRPLKNRINVAVTRDRTGSVEEKVRREWVLAREREAERKRSLEAEVTNNGKPVDGTGRGGESSAQVEKEEPDVLVSDSVASAISDLQQSFVDKSPSLSRNGSRELGHIYIIGGAEIYSSTIELFKRPAERHNQSLRIIMTDIRRLDEKSNERMVNGFECDTFFPLDTADLNLEDADESGLSEGHQARGDWREVSSEELAAWTGEKIESWKEEGGVVMKVRGFEMVEGN